MSGLNSRGPIRKLAPKCLAVFALSAMAANRAQPEDATYAPAGAVYSEPAYDLTGCPPGTMVLDQRSIDAGTVYYPRKESFVERMRSFHRRLSWKHSTKHCDKMYWDLPPYWLPNYGYHETQWRQGACEFPCQTGTVIPGTIISETPIGPAIDNSKVPSPSIEPPPPPLPMPDDSQPEYSPPPNPPAAESELNEEIPPSTTPDVRSTFRSPRLSEDTPRLLKPEPVVGAPLGLTADTMPEITPRRLKTAEASPGAFSELSAPASQSIETPAVAGPPSTTAVSDRTTIFAVEVELPPTSDDSAVSTGEPENPFATTAATPPAQSSELPAETSTAAAPAAVPLELPPVTAGLESSRLTTSETSKTNTSPSVGTSNESSDLPGAPEASKVEEPFVLPVPVQRPAAMSARDALAPLSVLQKSVGDSLAPGGNDSSFVLPTLLSRQAAGNPTVQPSQIRASHPLNESLPVTARLSAWAEALDGRFIDAVPEAVASDSKLGHAELPRSGCRIATASRAHQLATAPLNTNLTASEHLHSEGQASHSTMLKTRRRDAAETVGHVMLDDAPDSTIEQAAVEYLDTDQGPAATLFQRSSERPNTLIRDRLERPISGSPEPDLTRGAAFQSQQSDDHAPATVQLDDLPEFGSDAPADRESLPPTADGFSRPTQVVHPLAKPIEGAGATAPTESSPASSLGLKFAGPDSVFSTSKRRSTGR